MRAKVAFALQGNKTRDQGSAKRQTRKSAAERKAGVLWAPGKNDAKGEFKVADNHERAKCSAAVPGSPWRLVAAALAVVKKEEDDPHERGRERNRVGDYVGHYATCCLRGGGLVACMCTCTHTHAVTGLTRWGKTRYMDWTWLLA